MYASMDNEPANQDDRPFDWSNIAQELGLTDEQAAAYRERGEKIRRHAIWCGLKANEGGIMIAQELADEYGMDWLIRAMHLAVDTPKWPYVKGILKRAKAAGSMELPDKPGKYPEDKWFNPNADRSCLDEWGGLG